MSELVLDEIQMSTTNNNSKNNSNNSSFFRTPSNSFIKTNLNDSKLMEFPPIIPTRTGARYPGLVAKNKTNQQVLSTSLIEKNTRSNKRTSQELESKNMSVSTVAKETNEDEEDELLFKQHLEAVYSIENGAKRKKL